MICEGCQHQNPEGARFCNECGTPLKRKCPGCQAENPPKAKFCSECGQPLGGGKAADSGSTAETVKMTTEEVAQAMRSAVDAAPAAERRQLTVMFCDLANSTQISQALDPEDLRELVRDYQETCAQVVERFGGTIAQYLGDGILVYFGYPTAHEEDAQRAVRAGLGILEAIRDLSQSLKERESVDVAVRIGIHTGKVVVGEMGGGSKREQLALGDTPNIAARLQGLAELNSITISPATRQLTRGFFDTRSIGLHTLKGVADPMEVHEVRGESGIRHRLEVEEHRTPYIGREAELATLREAWKQTEDGRGQVVLVTGEGGIGKSRLVQVFKDAVESRAGSLQEAFCSPYFGNTALHPILELVRTGVGLTREDSNKERLHKLRRYLADARLDKAEALPFLAAALAIPPDAGYLPPNLSPQAQRQRTLEVRPWSPGWWWWRTCTGWTPPPWISWGCSSRG
jgi:class 3 adenylate cyclase